MRLLSGLAMSDKSSLFPATARLTPIGLRLAGGMLALIIAGCGGSEQTSTQANGSAAYGDASLVTDTDPTGEEASPERQNFEAASYSGSSTVPSVANKDAPTQIGTDAHIKGAWSPVREWPLIAIHTALRPDGQVVSYGTTAAGKQTGLFIYDVWDSSAGRADEGHTTLPNTTSTDIFCSSQTLLPSTGDLLINGGDNFVNNRTTNTGNSDSNVLSTANNQLTAGQSMNRARWYSSVTTLADGTQYIQGGSGGQDHPEIRGLNGSYTLLNEADTASLSRLYPRNFLAPDGRVFGIDVGGRMYFVDPNGSGYLDRLTNLTSAYNGGGSSAVMYAPDKILKIGANNSGSALVIDIGQALPQVSPTQAVSGKRICTTVRYFLTEQWL